MSREAPHSLKVLERALLELGKDWVVWSEAKILIETRIREARQTGWRLDKWAGTDLMMGGLMMGIEHLERRRAYIADLISRIGSGEIENSDAPAKPILSVVPGGRGE